MALSKEGRNYAGNQQQHQPRGKHHNRDGESDRGDRLLHQSSDLLDHYQPVGGLYAGTLKSIIENRIFVSRQIQAGCMLHHSNAYMARVLIAQ